MASFNNANAINIRLSLAYLSASLKAAGHEVNLIDTRLLTGWKQYQRLVKKQAPDFLGVSMHTAEFEVGIECCYYAKKVDETIKTCIGGIHPTMFPKQSLNTKVVDFVLRGEGEVSFPELIENPNKFPPSFWGKTPDLDAIPFLDRELWPDYKKRIQISFLGGLTPPVVELLTARGCPFHCKFCCGPGEQNLFSVEKDGKRVPYIRQRSVNNVMEELLQLYARYKFKGILIYDDQFLLNPKWVQNFCKAMHDYGFVEKGIEWFAACRANLIVKYKDIFEEMKNAGVKAVSVGYESFSDRMLKWLNKGTTVAQNWKASEILRKLDIRIYGNIIFGVPYSDGIWYREDDIKNVKAIFQIKPEYTAYSFFTPVPGSPLYRFCIEKNLFLAHTTNLLGSRLPNEAKIKGVDYKYLNRLISSVIKKPNLPFYIIFSKNKIIKDTYDKIKNYYRLLKIFRYINAFTTKLRKEIAFHHLKKRK